MCWLADIYFVYCEHHTRSIITPCVRASPSSGLATTGCWGSATTTHSRVLDFCQVCEKIGKATEADRLDLKDPFRVFAATQATQEGPKRPLPDVTVRPVEERGKGKDGGIWLKSFGGSSAAGSGANSPTTSAGSSRRNSEDAKSRRDSHHSVMSEGSVRAPPEILSPSRYSQGASAAWGMTPQELKARSTTLPPPDGRRSGGQASRPPRQSRPSNLDTVQEGETDQSQSSSCTRTRFNAVNDVAARRESHFGDEALSPARKHRTMGSPVSSLRAAAPLYDGLETLEQRIIEARQRISRQMREKQESFTQKERKAEHDRARLEVEQELMAKLRPIQRQNTERRLNQPDWVRWAIAKQFHKSDSRREDEKPCRQSNQPDWVREGIAGRCLKNDVRAVGSRDDVLREERRMYMMIVDHAAEKHMRKDSGICMEFDELE